MINSLTKEQVAKFPEYFDKYLKIGLDTKPITLKEARPIIDSIYTKILGKKTVPIIIMRNPVEAWLATIYVAYLFKSLSQVWSQVRSQVESQVWSQVWSQVGSQVRSQVESQVRSQVGSQVWSQVWSQVRSQVGSQVWSQVGSQVGSQVRSQVNNLVWPYLSGNLWSSYFSFYDFMQYELGLKLCAKYDTIKQMTSLHLIYPLDQACVLCDKPKAIHMSNGRLHRDGGYSIEYGGWGTYNLNGVAVPEWLAMTPDTKLSLDDFNKLKNADVRAEFIRKFGIDRMKKLGKLIDSHKKHDNVWWSRSEYELIDMAPIFKNVRYAPFLHMRNQTTETYHMEGVHPDCKTISDAIRFRCGQDVEIANIK